MDVLREMAPLSCDHIPSSDACEEALEFADKEERDSMSRRRHKDKDKD